MGYTKDDMGQALYRKYRSRNLGEIVGQEHITQTLANALKNNRISHAYLFTGPRGVGKTSIARIFAHEINKIPYSSKTDLDIIEIDAASNRRIDDIRDLRDKVHIMPTKAPYKVYIIDEVHMLTGESFNALLKTLEEPPAHVIFILATTEVHKLPATIISRTQRFTFRQIPAPQVIGHLSHIAKQEGIKITDNALELIADLGEGSFRDSISLLDQLANISDGKIDETTVEQTLGLAPQKVTQNLVEVLQSKDTHALIGILRELADSGANTSGLLKQLLKSLQKAAEADPQIYRLIDSLLDVPSAYDPWLKLTTTLVNFSQPELISTSEPKREVATPSAQKPFAPVTATAPIKQSTPIPEPKPIVEAQKTTESTYLPTPTTEITSPSSDLPELTPAQWESVVTTVKSKSQPAYAVLKAAFPEFDKDTNTLTLKFRFILHFKKMDDVKFKNILAQTMVEQLGSAPIIKAALDRDTPAPTIKPVESAAPQPTQPQPENETANSIMAMMGGGEILPANGELL